MRQQLKVLLSYFPTKIPVGLTDFNAWLDSIVELTGPIADADSIRWVVANEIMRLSPGRDRVAKQTLVRILRKFAANQLAAHTVNEIKQRQEDAKKAAQLAVDTSATTEAPESVQS